MYKFISPEDSFKIEKAISFLVEQYNKSGKNPKPVILHSIRVGMDLLDLGYGVDVIITGILHDLVEDTDVSIDDIKNNFSIEIAHYVDAVSFKSNIPDPVEQYKEMFNRTVSVGKVPVVVKSADIFANSFYIHLVPDLLKQRLLIQKMFYFISITESFHSEPALMRLKDKYKEENDRLSKLEK
jgi:(p)ppGpp synthase/HD superfamily hydrolase